MLNFYLFPQIPKCFLSFPPFLCSLCLSTCALGDRHYPVNTVLYLLLNLFSNWVCVVVVMRNERHHMMCITSYKSSKMGGSHIAESGSGNSKND